MKEKTIFGHPTMLFTLFFTEMWERFSYYGMRALLVLYMTKYLFIQASNNAPVWGYSSIRSVMETFWGPMSHQALSSQIYGLYTGFAYFTPFIGGYIADRFWGQRKSVYVGAILMAIGHFLMAIESLFFLALIVLIIGNGFFKPNISTQVGNLYAYNDERRDRAYTLFYMGINLGAFFSPLVCGTLGQKVGWHWGFGAAGVGMLIGLATYHWGNKSYLKTQLQNDIPKTNSSQTLSQAQSQPPSSQSQSQTLLKESQPKLEKWSRIPSGASSPQSLTPNEWKRTWALIFLCFVTIFFWGVYEQQGNTLQLWADQNTDLNFFGFEIPSTWYQSFNPLVIFFLAPLLDHFWAWQSRRQQEPSSSTKMAIGCFMGSAALLVMYVAAKVIGGGKGNLLWLLGSTFMLTIAELYISPIGLSLVTKIAPAKIVSMMMGVWFLAAFFGNNIAGIIGSYYDKISKDNFFIFLAFLAIIPGLLFFFTHKKLTRVLGEEV